MSPEQGLAVILTLLCGPTAIWLGYRALRGRPGRFSTSFNAVSEPTRSSQPAPDALTLEGLVDRGGFWVCWTCHSLNRPEANRCYGCHTAMGSAGQPPPGDLPVRRRVPVMAGVIARSAGAAARAPVASATTRTAVMASVVLAADPEPQPAAGASHATAAAPVCPYLGFRDDPSTRCDFPDPRNLCHATPGPGGGSFAPPRWSVTGKADTRRPQPIGAEHQRSSCLSATHEQCSRYATIQVVALTR
jgi:hypothetical protein